MFTNQTKIVPSYLPTDLDNIYVFLHESGAKCMHACSSDFIIKAESMIKYYRHNLQ